MCVCRIPGADRPVSEKLTGMAGGKEIRVTVLLKKCACVDAEDCIFDKNPVQEVDCN